MGGLVGVDTRMLDQNLSRRNVRRRFPIRSERRSHPSTVDFDVQVAGRRDLHLCDAVERTNFRAYRFGNFHRGRAQWLGKWKNRDGEVAEFHLRRLIDDYRWQRDAGM